MMAKITVCDGCKAQSPNPKTGLHVANSWVTVKATQWLGRQDDVILERIFCKMCWPKQCAQLQQDKP